MAIFPSSNKSCHFIGFKTCEKAGILRPGQSQKGSGSFPDLISQSTLHAHLQRVNVTKMGAMRFEQVQSFILAKKIF